MYCKHCGLPIAEVSKFCQHCGGRQDTIANEISEFNQKSETKVNMKIDGAIKATLSPSLPSFNGFKSFINKHKVYVICTSIWMLLNIILLSAGDDRNGFWPHIYSHRETIWEDKSEENTPYSISYHIVRVGHQGPTKIEVDWDLYYYGLTEFLVYAVLIPFISFFIYSAILKRNKNKSKKLYIIDPLTGLRRF